MYSSGPGSDFFEAIDGDVLARTSSESDSSFGAQLISDIGISEAASGIDLVLLTFLGSSAGKQVWLRKEKPGLLSLNLCKVLLRVSLLVSLNPSSNLDYSICVMRDNEMFITEFTRCKVAEKANFSPFVLIHAMKSSFCILLPLMPPLLFQASLACGNRGRRGRSIVSESAPMPLQSLRQP